MSLQNLLFILRGKKSYKPYKRKYILIGTLPYTQKKAFINILWLLFENKNYERLTVDRLSNLGLSSLEKEGCGVTSLEPFST